MNHFQLPYIQEKHRATARYGNVATSALIQMMIDDGSELKHLEAQIFGGAYNPKISPKDIGRRNVIVARKILLKKSVPVVSEDVFGEKGRKIILDTNTNEVVVLEVGKLRKKDWYPYEND
jgi:chemotaxis protein CheD